MTLLAFLQQGRAKILKKLAKIAKISEENFYIFNINIFMTFSRKMSLLIISEVTNNQGFTLSLENTSCENLRWVVKLTPRLLKV